MAEKRSSLGSHGDLSPESSRPSKRRRTLLGSVAEVAKWLLPSWASEHEAGARIAMGDDQPSASGLPIGPQHGRYGVAGSSHTLRNGERGSKRARLNNDLPQTSTRREVIGRLSPVTAPPQGPASEDVCDLDDGSDSSTSGCSSLSLPGPSASVGANVPLEDVNRRPSESTAGLNRPTSSQISSVRPSLQTNCTENSRTRDVSIAAEQNSIVAETSATGAKSLNFSLFSRPTRALSSTLNSTLPMATTHNRLLSSSLHKPERSLNRSIFYDGRTTYGGAAAHRKLNLFSPSPYQMSATRNRTAANVRVQGQSSAAKRLIQALERINTPVQNANRIPMGRPDSVASQDSELRRKEALETIASLRQTVPQTVWRNNNRVPLDNAKIGTNVTSAASGSYAIDVDSSEKSSSLQPPAASFSLVTSTPSARTAKPSETPPAEKAGGKFKSVKSIHSARKGHSIAEEEPAPAAPEYSAAPLPIKTLPSFSFTSKPVTSSAQESAPKAGSVRSPLTSLADFSNKPFEKSSVTPPCSGSSEVFTFAGPVRLAKPTGAGTAKDEEFKFKNPLYLSKGGNAILGNKTAAFTMKAPTMVVSNPGSLKVKEINKVSTPPTELAKSGSVLDALGTKDNKVLSGDDTESNNELGKNSGQWDCDKCTITNKPSDDNCALCGLEKSEPVVADTRTSTAKSEVPNQWGDFLKRSAGQWTCDTCTTPNKPEQTVCAACCEPRPASKGNAAPAKPTEPVASTTTKATEANNKATWGCVVNSFGGPAPKSSVKPASSFGGEFLTQPGWDCDQCSRMNNADNKTCACGATKGSRNSSSPAAPFRFGVPPSTSTSDNSKPKVTVPFGQLNNRSDESAVAKNTFKFGVPSTPVASTEKEDAKKDETAKDSNVQSTPFAAAAVSTATLAPTPSTAATTTTTTATNNLFGGIAFGAAAKVTPSSTTTPATPFVFGNVSTESKSTEEKKEEAKIPTFTPTASISFGAGSTASTATVAPTTTTMATSSSLFAFGSSTAPRGFSAPSAATFTFGSPTASSTSTTSATFSFGATPGSISSQNIFGGSSKPSETSATPAVVSTSNLSGTSLVPTATTTTAVPSVATSSTATATFGSALTATPKAIGFTFGKPASTLLNVTGSTPVVSSISTAPATTQPSKPFFSFDCSKAATAVATSPANSVAATPTVSSESAMPKSTAAAPAFVFGLPGAKLSTPTPASSASSGYNFAAANTSTPNLFTFGQPSHSVNNASATPTATTFGSPAPSASTATPTGATFGTLAGSGANPQASTSAFGSGTLPSAGSVFRFGAASPTPSSNPATAPVNPPFVFGQQNAAPAVSNNTPAPGQPSMFTFGSNSVPLNNPTSNPTGPPNANSSTASPFAFGAAASMTPVAPNDMFKFGTSPAQPTTGSTFQFGAQPTAPQAGTTATFQFGAPANPAAPPAVASFLNPSAIDNPFNATTGRKIKRAVRRKPAGR